MCCVQQSIMTSFDNLTSLQKLRASLHRDVRAISTETCHLLGLEITKPAMEIIAEMLFRKLSIYGSDLEAFAKHAKRNTVHTDDVRLLLRRNYSLKKHLDSATPNSAVKPKRRRTMPTKPEAIESQPKKPTPKADNPEKPMGVPIPNPKTGDETDDEEFQEALNSPVDLTFD